MQKKEEQAKNKKESSVLPQKPSPADTAGTNNTEEEVEDYTLHNWIRRCDLNYTRRKPVQSSTKDDTELSYEEEELGNVSSSTTSTTPLDAS